MPDSQQNIVFKALLHPATTVLFGIVGVVVGTFAITRSGNERPQSMFVASAYERALEEVKTEAAKTRSEIASLETQNDDLRSELSVLRSKMEAMEGKIAKEDQLKKAKKK